MKTDDQTGNIVQVNDPKAEKCFASGQNNQTGKYGIQVHTLQASITCILHTSCDDCHLVSLGQ